MGPVLPAVWDNWLKEKWVLPGSQRHTCEIMSSYPKSRNANCLCTNAVGKWRSRLAPSHQAAPAVLAALSASNRCVLVCPAMCWFPLLVPKCYSAPFTLRCSSLAEQLNGFSTSGPEKGVYLLKFIQSAGDKNGVKIASPRLRNVAQWPRAWAPFR